MAQTSMKVLAVGSANGQLVELFAKVATINSKNGPFDILLCSGDLFGENSDPEVLRDLINNKIDIPITTYFITGSCPLPSLISEHIQQSHGEVCNNLFHLGKQGVLTTAQGCRIAYLSGSHYPEHYDATAVESADGASNPSLPNEEMYFHSTDVASLVATPTPPSTPPGVDILLTFEWPQGIARLSSQKVPPSLVGAQPIAELAAGLQPRYHFAGKEKLFLEREPYRNVGGGPGKPIAGHVTRFIGLGEVGNKDKIRWFYAFNMSPLSSIQPSALLVQPPNTTDFPFLLSSQHGQSRGAKRPLHGGNAENSSFFWGSGSSAGGPSAGGDGRDNKRRAPPDTYVCNRCNVPGHWIKDCPHGPAVDPSAPKALPENYICRLCNTPGHHIKDCPEAANNKPSAPRLPPEGYICKICNESGHFVRECPKKEERDREHAVRGERRTREDSGEFYGLSMVVFVLIQSYFYKSRANIWCPEHTLSPLCLSHTADACWFCLANPKVAKHLIISIGSEIYLTLAKGPLTSSSSSGSLIPGGGHVLLIPISHYPSFRKIPMEIQIDVVAELERFKSALRRMFDGYGCDMVVFEVSRESAKGQTHAHFQVVPIPKEKSEGLEEAFVEEGRTQVVRMKFTKVLPENPDASYFKVDLPNSTSLVYIIKPQERFNLQFGRIVLAKILGTPDRADWKACPQSEDEEKRDAQAFKNAFREFDFTMD
ncbi:CwfJ C-terminus 1-domain-containing protein-like protein [Endogone sp. FLAS-F59071]|nr:CwfJ C-terminus 1-domain-containing protein-like protein [Endogone sp. FLAS-F59071]|eukprot:RUS21953.1 CwfJ C-terminus 1-domain-containing protein-like protein [Endogone sp. FLAS-F59071]